MSQSLTRRQILLGTGMFSLAASGCSRVPILDRTVKNFSHKGADPDQYPMTAAEIDALPYAALGAQFEGGSKAVLVLATVDGTVLQWAAANRSIIETQDGVIVHTEGLERNLIATRWDAANPLLTLAAGEQTKASIYRRIDVGLVDKPEKSVPITSTFKAGTPEEIKVLGTSHTVIRVDETADIKPWRWQTVNSYWIGVEDRQMWRSIQRFTPELVALRIELLSPYTAA